MDNIIYDYVIIGGGPSGLTMAYYLNKFDKKCVVIDSNNSLGGCHRVERVDGLFCEHSPRIYSDSYLNTNKLLNNMNIRFDEIFTKYHFSATNMALDSIKNFTNYELFILFLEFLKLLFGSDSSGYLSVLEFMKLNKFSDKAIDFSDRMCRMSDGAGNDRYPLFEFLQLVNQQSLYNLYDLKLPSDIGLFKIWREKMQGVDIIMNTKVDKINISNNTIIDINGFKGLNYILAIPPEPLYSLLKKNKIENTFIKNYEFKKWKKENSYIDDICIVFHWNTKLVLEDVWGFPKSDWNVVFKILSNYMDFKDDRSQTVISCGITHTDKKSKFTNKTANESTKDELIAETFRQLNESFKLPISPPTYSIMSPNVYYKDGEWETSDDAYIMSSNKNTYIPFQSNDYKNLYNVGTQNGYSKYYFTSLESAVTNALALLQKLEPKLPRKNRIDIQNPITIIEILRWFITVIIVYKLYKMYHNMK